MDPAPLPWPRPGPVDHLAINQRHGHRTVQPRIPRCILIIPQQPAMPLGNLQENRPFSSALTHSLAHSNARFPAALPFHGPASQPARETAKTYLYHLVAPAVGAVNQDVVPWQAGNALDAVLVSDGDLELDEVADADPGAAAVQVRHDSAVTPDLPAGQHRGPRDGSPRVEVGDGEVARREDLDGREKSAEGVAEVGLAEAGEEGRRHSFLRFFFFSKGRRELDVTLVIYERSMIRCAVVDDDLR